MKEKMTSNTNATETSKKKSKRVKNNVSCIVKTFGKTAIDLLVEYCKIYEQTKTNIDTSAFNGKVITEMSCDEIQGYLMIKSIIEQQEKREEILAQLAEYGISIDMQKNIDKQKKDKDDKAKSKKEKEIKKEEN